MKIITITACSNCPHICVGGVGFQCSLIGDQMQYDITGEFESYIRGDCPLGENNVVDLLTGMVKACRYIAPKSNALNDAYHNAKKFLTGER